MMKNNYLRLDMGRMVCTDVSFYLLGREELKFHRLEILERGSLEEMRAGESLLEKQIPIGNFTGKSLRYLSSGGSTIGSTRRAIAQGTLSDGEEKNR
jgi:hypothetical protein